MHVTHVFRSGGYSLPLITHRRFKYPRNIMTEIGELALAFARVVRTVIDVKSSELGPCILESRYRYRKVILRSHVLRISGLMPATL